jgi:hypothetical protein
MGQRRKSPEWVSAMLEEVRGAQLDVQARKERARALWGIGVFLTAIGEAFDPGVRATAEGEGLYFGVKPRRVRARRARRRGPQVRG